GTAVHGVEVRIPGAGPIGVGYLQRPGERLLELHTVTARETFADNGLPIDTVITLAPGDLTLTATPIAHAPVVLVAADGRVSQFPRAWVSVTTADGRSGTGWMEWNRNAGTVSP
ncbi:MAG TPA: phosphotransferase, partial [Mycobacterium sp.]|nr:phosphotransferase [Mycobacterium sp.]